MSRVHRKRDMHTLEAMACPNFFLSKPQETTFNQHYSRAFSSCKVMKRTEKYPEVNSGINS